MTDRDSFASYTLKGGTYRVILRSPKEIAIRYVPSTCTHHRLKVILAWQAKLSEIGPTTCESVPDSGRRTHLLLLPYSSIAS